MDLISTFTKLQNAQDPLCVAYMFLAALALRHAAILPSRNLSWITISLGVLVIGVYLIKLASYLLYPNFADHVEATVASISWLGMHGREFYPNWVVDDIYGLVYGPVLYLVQGLLLLIVPTITALKIMGVVSLLLAFVLTFMVVKHKVADSNLTLFYCRIGCGNLCGHACRRFAGQMACRYLCRYHRWPSYRKRIADLPVYPSIQSDHCCPLLLRRSFD